MIAEVTLWLLIPRRLPALCKWLRTVVVLIPSTDPISS
jgi:hypothetical protein